jgi:hypothetical protein
MDNNTVNNVTNNIDTLLFINQNSLSEIIHEALHLVFPDLKKLLDLTPEMRKQLLSKWKYYEKFIFTIEQHSNNQQLYPLVSWEESFTSTLLLSIYN